ncbi:SapC family protein [Bosea sp. (in: a-proteobacteria)]|uniref:SapC family protein n=1 Tax=Bosea sp. (in: a-proteobacteria) TaxID=1871050 RepID=UPI0027352310|nr:SapC family protein [Bosea sp. (in: a-proteobacteria)]MDP3408840.1 SapC family protein [Bosea sp. (in: a-proteobacteria)]
MTPLPLFYSSIAVLDRDTHRQSRLAPTAAPYAFAARSHVLPALMAEFAAGCRDMPILFLEEQDSVSPLFMVGMRSGENGLVDADGRWRGLHAPAYLRRYPFIGGEVSAQQQIVCIDGGFAGLQESEGERLFTEEGEPTEALQRVVAFVAEYAEAAKATAAFTAALKALDLFQTITVEIRSPDGSSSSFSGFSAISEERLNAQPDETLLDLKHKGYLAPIYAHLISLANFALLGERAVPRA